LTLQFFNVHLLYTANEVRSLSSSCDITGAAVDSLDQ